MLKVLELKNFKRHESISIVFTDGLNLITGPNYSGKSTLLHGILFCLFGVSAVPGGAAIVVRKGSKSVSGVLEFDAGGCAYRIERTKSSAKIFEDGELAATGNSPVLKAIEEVLGMTKKQYMQLQYSQQKQTEALLTVGAAQLNATIEDVSGVDLVNDVLAKCKSIVTTVKGGLDVLSAEVDIDELVDDIKDKTHQSKRLKARTGNLKEVEQEQSEWVGKTRQSLSDAEISNAKVETGMAMQKKLTARMENIELAIAAHQKTMDENPEPVGSSVELQDEYDSALEDFTTAERTSNDDEQLGRQLIRTERVFKEESQEIEDLRTQLIEHPAVPPMEVAQAEYDTSKAELVSIQTDMNLKKKSIAEGVCSACGQTLEGHDDSHGLANEVIDLQDQMEKLRPIVEERAEAYKLASTGQKVIDRLQSQISVLEKPLATREAELVALQAKRADLVDVMNSEELEVMSMDVTALQKRLARAATGQAGHDAAKKVLAEAQAQLKTAQADYDEISIPVLIDIDEIGIELAEASASHTGAVEQHSQAVRELESLNGVLRALEYDLDRAKKDKVTRDDLSQKLAVATSLQKYLRDNRDRFLSQVWSGVMGYSGSFASSCTAGEIEGLSREVEGGGFVYNEAGEQFIVEAASGAQKSIMGLGVQMALSQLLPCSLRCVMLDEPTADMDDEKALTLSTILSQADEQVIMVSHRSLDSSVANNSISLEG